MRGLYFDVLCPVRPASDPEGCVGGVSVFWAFGEFRRPGGEFLFHVEKEPKDAGGRRRGELRSPMTAYPQTPFYGGCQLSGLVFNRKGAGGLVDSQSLVFRCRFVVAKSACLRFRLAAKTAPASLLLLSNANPLRWALRWGPPSAACISRGWDLGTPLLESAFVAVGLKCGSDS